MGFERLSILPRMLSSLLTGFQVGVIFAAVVYVTWQNTFLASDWWTVSLRDIDDYAMNGAVEDLRRELESGGWRIALSFFAYAYGIGFWFLMVAITTPLHLLELGELQIFLGRTLSLAAVLATSLVVAMIGQKLYPQSTNLWLVAVGFGLLTPMSLINGTKLHVNSWMMLLGALAIYVLVSQSRLSAKALYLAAFLMGLAIGFKLTALVLLPVFAAMVFVRGRELATKHLLGAAFSVPLFAVLSGFPVIILSPILPEAASYVIGVFNTFSGLGTDAGRSGEAGILEGLAFFGNPWIVVALFALLILLGIKSLRSGQSSLSWALPLSVSFTLAFTWTALPLLIDKPAIYLATYSLSISVFLPLGTFALVSFSSNQFIRLALGWALVLGNLFSSPNFAAHVLGAQNYAAIASSPSMERKLNAAREIELLIGDVAESTTVLLDSHSVFPLSDVDNSVSLRMSYGNLGSLADDYARGVRFEYIVLDSESYHEMPNSSEDALRASLQQDGKLWSASYELIYSKYGTLVFELVDP